MADTALESLLLDEGRGRGRLPEDALLRWETGAMSLAEKRKIVASVLVNCLVHPGVKAAHSWDFSRVEPVWR
ncbi:hypothetical protein [Streptomyces sp. SAI-117]|uniref:hypothetical protein n=1 Tax=Streptomyces sp. SAI-117 TaxID=2940546 RepID=UPI0024741D19|nr:hypothetical protein [Streptomyces sp. SAI-117]